MTEYSVQALMARGWTNQSAEPWTEESEIVEAYRVVGPFRLTVKNHSFRAHVPPGGLNWSISLHPSRTLRRAKFVPFQLSGWAAGDVAYVIEHVESVFQHFQELHDLAGDYDLVGKETGESLEELVLRTVHEHLADRGSNPKNVHDVRWRSSTDSDGDPALFVNVHLTHVSLPVDVLDCIHQVTESVVRENVLLDEYLYISFEDPW